MVAKAKAHRSSMEGRHPRPLKMVETVNTEGSWCCLARSSSMPSSPRTPSGLLKSKELSKPFKDEVGHKDNDNAAKPIVTEAASEVIYRKLEKKKRSGEMTRAGEALKNGEISALLKQGFIGGGGALEKGNGSPFKIRLSPGRVSPLVDASSSPISPAVPNFAKLNSVLNNGFLSQSSPPVEKMRSSPTLFEMMVHEQEMQDKSLNIISPQLSLQSHGKHLCLQDRILSVSSPGSQFNDASTSDVRLTLTSSRDGSLSVTLSLHGQILAAHSRLFATMLSERWSKQTQQVPHIVQISDCEDLEAYVETLRLMYCRDVRRRLLKESVSRVLSILKISAAIVFEAGVLSCLEYLEAVPWAEEEEPKVISLVSQLRLESIGAGEVLKRLSTDDSSSSQDVLVRLLHLVTKGTDEKARREMKGLVSRMLRENAAQAKNPTDVSKESIYESCHECVESLLHFFVQAASQDIAKSGEDRCLLMAHITRHADNLNWLVDILIDRHIADDFVKLWAFQDKLASLHSQVPIPLGRYEVSRLTARLCVAIGKGQVLAAKEIRFALLQNWLQPLIDDFGWMQRACKGLDRGVVEEGISQTILTLPLKQQQSIMIAWFDRFLKNGDDCPNLQRAFETWWRRTFVRPQVYTTCPSPSQAPLLRQAITCGGQPKEALPSLDTATESLP